MATAATLTAEARAADGKGAARKVRAEGKLPAVLYGTGLEPRSLAISRHDFIRILHAHGAHPLVQLDIDGAKELALVKEVQIDAVKHAALHVDFHRVQADQPVQTLVAVHTTGTSAGVKLGGVLELHTREVMIEALPLEIPEAIEVDITDVDLNALLRVGDITPPAGVRIVTDAEETLLTVAPPKVTSLTPATAEEEGAEVAAEGEGAAAEGGESASS